MGDADFDELSGRLEALARLVLNLVAELEDAGLMDGAAFAERNRNNLPRPAPGADERQQAVLNAAARTLRQMADSIDSARNHRQVRGHGEDGQSRQID